MEVVVPQDVITVEVILEMMWRYSGPHIAEYCNVVRVSKNRMIFDLKLLPNLFFPDFYFPLKTEKIIQSEMLSSHIWQMMTTGSYLPQEYARQIFDCIDTSQKTSERFIEKLKWLGGRMGWITNESGMGDVVFHELGLLL
jgi:hypothetical protein